MNFFERFKPKSNKIESGDDLVGKIPEHIQKEPSLDDTIPELNQSLKTKMIITGENPLEPDERDQESVENLLVRNAEDFQIINDNIRLLMSEISHNNDKIKQLKESINKTEDEINRSGDITLTVSLEKLTKMKDSLIKLNQEKEIQIQQEEQKINGFYNLN